MYEKYMKLALEEAIKGIGAVNPNPLVGAIIVKDDEIISCFRACLQSRRFN